MTQESLIYRLTPFCSQPANPPALNSLTLPSTRARTAAPPEALHAAGGDADAQLVGHLRLCLGGVAQGEQVRHLGLGFGEGDRLVEQLHRPLQVSTADAQVVTGQECMLVRYSSEAFLCGRFSKKSSNSLTQGLRRNYDMGCFSIGKSNFSSFQFEV